MTHVKKSAQVVAEEIVSHYLPDDTFSVSFSSAVFCSIEKAIKARDEEHAARVLALLRVVEAAAEMREHICHGEYMSEEAKALLPTIDAFDKAIEEMG